MTFVDSDLPNSEIQNILNSAPEGSDVEFLGDYYFDIALEVNGSLNIYSLDTTILNAKAGSPVFKILNDNVNITGFSINGNSGDAIEIISARNVLIRNNIVSNTLDENKIPDYVEGTIDMPGYGITVLNSSEVKYKVFLLFISKLL